MPQKTSPFLEGKWGWDLGEDLWNTGADENWLKFSYMFDSNVDGIVSSLPPAVNGTAYFNTVDNRFYFVVDGTYYSSPCPKWFVFVIRTTGETYQFNGTNPVQIETNSSLSGRVSDVESDLEEIHGDNGADTIGVSLSLAGSISRSIQDFAKDFLPTIEFFGGKGDYVTDNLLPVALAIASGAKGVKFGMGIYSFSNGFDKPQNFMMVGETAPELGFGTVDAKQFLREGYRHLMPGTVLAFKGTGTLTASFPQRSDEFSSVRYCIRSVNTGIGSLGATLRDLAIIQDMICFDADGVATKPGFENKSDYEVGHLFDDSAQEVSSNVVVFGYFPKAGTVIISTSGNDDPDYNKFVGGSTMGKHGLAILGSSTPAAYGLSGTAGHRFKMYTLDHHSRGTMTGAERIAYYANADTWSCLYIDGDVDASSAEINGHYFYDCLLRTRANTPLRLGKASNVQFYGGVCEITPYGIPGSDVPKFVGSADVKRGVGFYGMRNNFLGTIFNPEFVGLIPVPVIVSGDPLNGRLGVFGKNPAGGYSGSILGSDGNIGDAAIQLTDDANNGSSGWRMSIDISETPAPLNFKKDGITKLVLSEAGTVTIPAPASSDALILLSSNGGTNLWAIRPQVSSAGQLQFRFGGSGSPVLWNFLTNGHLTAGSTGTQDIGSTATHFRDTYSNRYFIGTGTIQQISGSGSPEGVVTAPVGSTFQRSDGGALTSFYVKESGTGNTGWVAK